MTFNRGNTKAARLTAVEVNEIREKYATGIYTYDRLAIEYGVSVNTIRSIVKGTSWQFLPMVTPVGVVDDAAVRSQRKLESMLSQTAALGGDVLPTEEEIGADVLAAMQAAVESSPQPEFLKPSTDMAERMAGYGVRPPTSTTLIDAIAATECGAVSAQAVEQAIDEVTKESGK